MTDPRLERLRQIDAAAIKPPWECPAGRMQVNERNGELIATARNILPATIELLEGVLQDGHARRCPACYKAALAVLDQIGDDDG